MSKSKVLKKGKGNIMKTSTIAVLGPKGTFTELAAMQYQKTLGIEGELQYYKTMRTTFDAIGSTCDFGVIPIENTLDGFVQIILDLLTHCNLKIIHELVLPIHFGLIGNAMDIDEIQTIYAQFKTQNQCLNFLETMSDKSLITTASNAASYDYVVKGETNVGAIVPMHLIDGEVPFPLKLNQIADSMDNETRFIVLAPKDYVMDMRQAELEKVTQWKTLLVIHGDRDRPGLLVDILNLFSEESINLVSIISRPTKKGLGTYNFFIDVEGCYERDERVKRAVQKAYDHFDIQILGSYYRV